MRQGDGEDEGGAEDPGGAQAAKLAELEKKLIELSETMTLE